MDGDLVVTLRLEPAAQERFEALRHRHFPPRRNVVPAHVVLFHALPATEPVTGAVAAAADRAPVEVTVRRARSLGHGVAFDLASPGLSAVHAAIARDLEGSLTPQDRQAYAPHVTVQNKVDPAVARATLAELMAGFTPWTCLGLGLEVWTYRGGPWEPRSYEPFRR